MSDHFLLKAFVVIGIVSGVGALVYGFDKAVKKIGEDSWNFDSATSSVVSSNAGTSKGGSGTSSSSQTPSSSETPATSSATSSSSTSASSSYTYNKYDYFTQGTGSGFADITAEGQAVTYTETMPIRRSGQPTLAVDGIVYLYVDLQDSGMDLPTISIDAEHLLDFPASEKVGDYAKFTYKMKAGATVTASWASTSLSKYYGYLYLHTAVFTNGYLYATGDNRVDLTQNGDNIMAPDGHAYALRIDADAGEDGCDYQPSQTTASWGVQVKITQDGTEIDDASQSDYAIAVKFDFTNAKGGTFAIAADTGNPDLVTDAMKANGYSYYYRGDELLSVSVSDTVQADWSGSFTLTYVTYYGDRLIPGSHTVTVTLFKNS